MAASRTRWRLRRPSDLAARRRGVCGGAAEDNDPSLPERPLRYSVLDGAAAPSKQTKEQQANISILGTGNVAHVLAGRWAESGHKITLGSRDPEAKGDLAYAVANLAEAVRSADVVVNATPGTASIDVVEQIGSAAFAGKVLLDLANAPTPAFELTYPNTSLGQALQEALPAARVVKTLNTVAAPLMADPSSIGPSTVFMSGDDSAAKATVGRLLGDLGWPEDAILDLGGIASARGPEHYFLLFAAVWQALGTSTFNVNVVRQAAP